MGADPCRLGVKRLARLLAELALTAIALWCLARIADLPAAPTAAAPVTAAMMAAGLAFAADDPGVRHPLGSRGATVGSPLSVADVCALSSIGDVFGRRYRRRSVRIWKAHRNGLALPAAIYSGGARSALLL